MKQSKTTVMLLMAAVTLMTFIACGGKKQQSQQQAPAEYKTVKVARYDIGKRKWKILSFEIKPFRGKFECEIYPIYYTNEEYSEFKKVLAQ